MDTILQIGKGGIAEQLIKQVDDALSAREMIKLKVLENSFLSAREAATQLAEANPMRYCSGYRKQACFVQTKQR